MWPPVGEFPYNISRSLAHDDAPCMGSSIPPLYALARHAARYLLASFDSQPANAQPFASVLLSALRTLHGNRSQLSTSQFAAVELAHDTFVAACGRPLRRADAVKALELVERTCEAAGV